MSATRLRIREIQTFERSMRFARPFRFGLVTVDEAPQAFVRVVVEVEGAGLATGVTAEMMMPKWFDKNPAKSPQDTIADCTATIAGRASNGAAKGDSRRSGRRTPSRYARWLTVERTVAERLHRR